MKELIETFVKQLREAFILGENTRFTPYDKPIKNVVIAGLGGSGIGGTIVSEIVSTEAKIPITVSKGYSLPAYVDKDTLVIVSSYSGNTEETLSTFKAALTAGAKIVCVTSGGILLEEAARHGLDCVVIPGGMPPRACLGYSLVQLFFILNAYAIISGAFKKQLKNACDLLEAEEETIQKEAYVAAEMLFNKICIIYAPTGSEGVAVRFKQQLNENTKTHAWHAVIPEMNHNEIVGWMGKNDHLAVVFFRNHTDNARIQKRIEICKEIISKYTSTIVEIFSQGDSPLERALYHIHFGDWVSTYLPEMAGIDASEVKNVDYLKLRMGEEE